MKFTQPTDFGLIYPTEQRLPEPFTEIDLEEYIVLMHLGGYSLDGINFNQLFLDWGEGPLIKNPKQVRDFDGTTRAYTGHGGWDGFSNQFGVQMFWLHGYGVAVAEVYITAKNVGKTHLLGKGMFIPDRRSFVTETGWLVRFFRLGCEHEMYELSREECEKEGIFHAGKFWHVEKCKKCGWIQAYDTSG